MKKSYYSVALNISISCALLIEEYPVTSFCLAIAFNSATVISSNDFSSFCGPSESSLAPLSTFLAMQMI